MYAVVHVALLFECFTNSEHLVLSHLKILCLSFLFFFQISIVIDGTKKVVEFMFRGAEGDLLNYVFKNRELRPLFDRQWHKLGIGVESQVLSLYMDCNLIASRHTEEKDSVDFHGKTVIAARASDGKPVDVSCNSDANGASTSRSSSQISY